MKTLIAILLLAGCGWGQQVVVPPNLKAGDCLRALNSMELAKVDCPEPMDVPATTRKQVEHHAGDSWGCGMLACTTDKDIYIDVPTCADKRRVLLTSEDGKKHCVLFVQEQEGK